MGCIKIRPLVPVIKKTTYCATFNYYKQCVSDISCPEEKTVYLFLLSKLISVKLVTNTARTV